ncbi:hypothetical protein NVP2275O_115 [Vibrio phage 2.275.O._10N.286.54.E11]|nr:hypothetical protein NVP2275O_115 [Vibrio phage 2.275.O._10N.286.54.E11]
MTCNEVKIWDNKYKDHDGFIDLGSCSGLANRVLHELYAFPSSFPGHFEVGARFGIDSDYSSMCTLSMGGPEGLAYTVRRNTKCHGDKFVYLEIYEAHKRLYETDAWKSREHLRTREDANGYYNPWSS